MSVVHDIVKTCSLLTSRAVLWGGSRNPYAYQAGAALVLGLVLAVAGAWKAFSGELTIGLLALMVGLSFLAYWRHILPKAVWYSNVERTLDGE